MKNIRTYFNKFILFAIALQILNLSVYGSEYEQQYMDKNGHVAFCNNQIDCVAEFVAEVILDYRNAMPENKGNHTKNKSKIIKAQIQLIAQNIPVTKVYKTYPTVVKHGYYNNQYDYLFYKEINPPPPKVA